MNYEPQQKEICSKYNVIYVASNQNFKVGISKTVLSGLMPIHGLRHLIEGDTTGWYIWSGEFRDDPDFFAPMHVSHLKNICPCVLKYLGFPPGYRFLIDDKGYEDVWEDLSLLNM